MLPGSSLDDAARRADQLRGKIEALVVRYLDQNLPRITISVGAATFPDAGDTPESVMRTADAALYRAKANGRNRVETAGQSDADAQRRSATEPAVRLVEAADG